MPLRAEGGPGDGRHLLLLEQPFTPFNAGGRTARLAKRLADVKEGVKGAADVGNPYAGQLPEPAHHQVATGLKRSPHLGHAVLRSGQRLECRMLADAARVARLLALQAAHRLGQRGW